MKSIIVALIVSCVVSFTGYKRKWLSQAGALTAVVIGTAILGLGGWRWAILLGWFFVSSSVLSRYKEDEKRVSAEKFDKGSQRDAIQVLANGGLGALIAICHALWPSPLWYIFFVGVMAAVSADTYATELGTLSKKPPRLITSGQRVEVGTSGGVSSFGTLVSLVGGFLIGALAGLMSDASFIALLCAGSLGGLAGSLFDSLLGATVQKIYYCDICDKETEKQIHTCQMPTRPLRGWAWMTNDVVNFLASIVGGAVAIGVFSFAW